MLDRISEQPSLCVSMLSVDMPERDLIVGLSLGCEAVRTLFGSLLSKTGPVGVGLIGSLNQGLP